VAAELADALEPVADRMAMGEQGLGGRGDVAVVVEVGLDGGDELGLVLLVVGGERGDRLVEEALELGRVLAHRGEQQAVGAGLLERERRAALGLGDVGRHQGFLAGAIDLCGVLGVAAEAGGHCEAREGTPELVLDRLSGPFDRAGVGSGKQHRYLAPVLPRRRRQRAAAAGADGAQRQRQDAGPPIAGLGRVRGRPDDDDAAAGREIAAELGRAGADLVSIGEPALEHGPQEVAGRLIARPFRGAGPLDLEAEQRGHHPQSGRHPVGTTAPPVAKLSDGDVRHPQLGGADAGCRRQQLLLLGAGGGGDGEDGARAVDQGEAGVEHGGGGTGHRRQAGA
jgi:hypothetical protein